MSQRKPNSPCCRPRAWHDPVLSVYIVVERVTAGVYRQHSITEAELKWDPKAKALLEAAERILDLHTAGGG